MKELMYATWSAPRVKFFVDVVTLAGCAGDDVDSSAAEMTPTANKTIATGNVAKCVAKVRSMFTFLHLEKVQTPLRGQHRVWPTSAGHPIRILSTTAR